jgi:ribonuclease III
VEMHPQNEEPISLTREVSQRLTERLGYTFRNERTLLEALTHSTFAYEHRQAGLISNERLEFLGDAVLDQVVSEFLFQQPELLSEGTMTRTRALVVCENTLARLARKLGIGDVLLMGRGEIQTGGRSKPSNLANAMEALFGAIFLDGGYDAVRHIILHLLDDPLRQALAGQIVYDYKSRLLELAQAVHASPVRFAILDEQGPVHERTFTAGVYVGEKLIAQGNGNSKKEAEQQAARFVLALLENDRSLLSEPSL